VRFSRLGPEAVEARLGDRAETGERHAAARLSGGDLGRAAFLLEPLGQELRAAVELLVRAVRTGELGGAPWEALAKAADAAGERESAAVRARAAEAEEDAAERTGPAARRRAREAEEAAKRGSRRERNATLDLGLSLFGAWMRDLAALAEGAPELVFNSDRGAELAELAEGLDPRRARRAGELVIETRRRLQVNVSEALALEALAFRVDYLLAQR
jgi:DNA polymerase-3 subunit delta'